MSGVDAEVLLLAAGYGKRLRPLTDRVPKPLIEVGGKALLDWNLQMIARAGFRRVFINLFYLKDQIRNFVGDGSRWALDIELVEESVLLDTGGAIKNIEPWLESDSLITVNSDILLGFDFSLREVWRAHRGHPAKPLVTMVLRPDINVEQYGAIEVDASGRVCGYLGKSFGSKTVPPPMMYTGVQVLSRDSLLSMPERGSVFSVTRDTHLKILTEGKAIASYIYYGYWSDLGTPERLVQASKDWDLILGVP